MVVDDGPYSDTSAELQQQPVARMAPASLAQVSSLSQLARHFAHRSQLHGCVYWQTQYERFKSGCCTRWPDLHDWHAIPELQWAGMHLPLISSLFEIVDHLKVHSGPGC